MANDNGLIQVKTLLLDRSMTGAYVSIRGEDGEMHTYKVASVEPAT
jgi:hypothetical protein